MERLSITFPLHLVLQERGRGFCHMGWQCAEWHEGQYRWEAVSAFDRGYIQG